MSVNELEVVGCGGFKVFEQTLTVDNNGQRMCNGSHDALEIKTASMLVKPHVEWCICGVW